MRKTFLSLTLAAGTLLAGTAGAEPRPFGAEDLVTMQRLSGPRVSPDGSVTVMIVLLKLACTWITALGTVRRGFFFPVFCPMGCHLPALRGAG